VCLLVSRIIGILTQNIILNHPKRTIFLTLIAPENPACKGALTRSAAAWDSMNSCAVAVHGCLQKAFAGANGYSPVFFMRRFFLMVLGVFLFPG
jgi:hypothetical protein